MNTLQRHQRDPVERYDCVYDIVEESLACHPSDVRAKSVID
jgi:hypothetical protein